MAPPFIRPGESLEMTAEQEDAALEAQVKSGLRSDWAEVRYSLEQAFDHLGHIYVALARPDHPQLANGKAQQVRQARDLIRELRGICEHWGKVEAP
jgi:hypothetical protein